MRMRVRVGVRLRVRVRVTCSRMAARWWSRSLSCTWSRIVIGKKSKELVVKRYVVSKRTPLSCTWPC